MRLTFFISPCCHCRKKTKRNGRKYKYGINTGNNNRKNYFSNKENRETDPDKAIISQPSTTIELILGGKGVGDKEDGS
jgi:hypothetical protein